MHFAVASIFLINLTCYLLFMLFYHLLEKMNFLYEIMIWWCDLMM